MRDDEQDPRPKPTTETLGEDLSRLSVAELEGRVARLKAEIARVEAAIAAKRSVEDAANALFKR